MKLMQPSKTNTSTAFRLPQWILEKVDQVCSQNDLTRSQVFRRGALAVLKSHQVDIEEPQPTATWSQSLYKRVGQ